MDPHDNTYRSWLLADPKAFVAGVRGFCKQAAFAKMAGGGTLKLSPDDPDYVFATTHQGDKLLSSDDPEYAKYMALHRRAIKKIPAVGEEKSLWEKVKPWVFGLAAGFLALKGGETWGRFAQKHNYKEGPIIGPPKALLGAFLNPGIKLRGTKTRKETSSPPVDRYY